MDNKIKPSKKISDKLNCDLKNRLAVVLATTILTALVVGGVVYLWQQSAARNEQARIVADINNDFKQQIEGLQKQATQDKNINEYILKDNQVYYQDKQIAGADFATFETIKTPLRYPAFAKDNKRVYYDGNVIEGADPETFKVVYEKCATNKGSWETVKFLKDKNNVYIFSQYASIIYEELVVEGADPETFERVGVWSTVEMGASFFYKDKNRVYCGTSPQESIDVDTFEYLGMYSNPPGVMPGGFAYTKDKNHVYYLCDDILEGADPESFKVLTDGYAKDKNHIYSGDWKMNVDYSSFVVLGDYFAKDNKNIFYDGEIIKGAELDLCSRENIPECLPENWEGLIRGW